MNLERFTGPGSTPARRRFWDKVQEAVMASRKVAGRNVTIDEHSGAGSVINTPDRSRSTPTPPGDCPPANPCTLDLTFTSDVYSVLQTGLSINPGVCDTLGWNGVWESNCANDTCGHVTNFCVSLGSPSCVCGVRLEWIEDVGQDDPARVRIVLGKIVGDDTLDDGWYLWANAEMRLESDSACFWETVVCHTFPCTCVHLGDLSVFDTELSVSIPMPADPINGGACGGDATLDLTFYPC